MYVVIINKLIPLIVRKRIVLKAPVSQNNVTKALVNNKLILRVAGDTTMLVR